jgi:hypothetical protein
MDVLTNAILKLSTQQEEILLEIKEIKETITKQRNDVLLERISKLETSMKDQHIKLDALNAIDINPTIDAPRPAAVRVAGAKKKADEAKDDKKADEVEEDAPQQFSTITEFFKHIWVTDRAKIYAMNVYSEKEYDDIYAANKEAFDKKKNELLLQKAVAFKIWRSLSDERKEVVKALKNAYTTDLQKKASKEIVAEDE